MPECKGIINLYNKTKLKCKIITDNPEQFINSKIDKQDLDKIYLYLFDGSKYLSINSTNKVIEKVTDSTKLATLWSIYGLNGGSIDTTLHKLKLINKTHFDNKYIPTHTEYNDFINRVVNELNENNDNNQNGGVLLLHMQNSLNKILPDTAVFTIDILLDIIDLVLVLITAAPNTSDPISGLQLNILSLIYSILRFDLLGTAASMISFVPLYGQLISLLVGTGSKINKYVTKYNKYNKYKENEKQALKFGSLHGREYNIIIEFTADYGKPGFVIIDLLVNKGYIDNQYHINELPTLTNDRLNRIISFINNKKHGTTHITEKITNVKQNNEQLSVDITNKSIVSNKDIILKAGEFGVLLGDKAITIIENGENNEYKKDRVEAQINATKILR
jgi:hypothetical protein